MNDHHEFAYIYSCYDPAIRDEILKASEERFGKGNYFFDTDPGAVKNLVAPRAKTDIDFVLYKIQLGVKVHPYTHLLLINHSNCGAYADAGISFVSPETEAAYHKTQLEDAVALLKKKLPNNITIEHHYFLKKEQQFAW